MRIHQRFILLVAAAAIATTCGHSEPPQPLSLTINGPSQITPGLSASYSATMKLSDGTSLDYSSRVGWTTSNPQVLTMDLRTSGLARALMAGEALLMASVGQTRGTLNVLVLPTGTFRLTGTVTSGGTPVQGATVFVVSGTGAGLSTSTDGGGRYRLYGVAGIVGLEVTKVGYVLSNQTVTVTDQTTADVTLSTSDPPGTVQGVYSMVVTASPACNSSSGPPLPADLKSRHYTATVTRSGNQLQVALSGATFVTKGGLGAGFSATVTPSGVTFQLNDGYYYSPYPDVLERLSDQTALLIDGFGSLSRVDTTLTGTLSGDFDIVNLPLYSSGTWFVSTCYSPVHQIVMTPVTTATPARRRR